MDGGADNLAVKPENRKLNFNEFVANVLRDNMGMMSAAVAVIV